MFDDTKKANQSCWDMISEGLVDLGIDREKAKIKFGYFDKEIVVIKAGDTIERLLREEFLIEMETGSLSLVLSKSKIRFNGEGIIEIDGYISSGIATLMYLMHKIIKRIKQENERTEEDAVKQKRAEERKRKISVNTHRELLRRIAANSLLQSGLLKKGEEKKYKVGTHFNKDENLYYVKIDKNAGRGLRRQWRIMVAEEPGTYIAKIEKILLLMLSIVDPAVLSINKYFTLYGISKGAMVISFVMKENIIKIDIKFKKLNEEARRRWKIDPPEQVIVNVDIFSDDIGQFLVKKIEKKLEKSR